MAKTVGIILAGGKGERFGGSTPKQFVKLAGKMVIEHTVEIFELSADIDEIEIVTRPEHVELIWNLCRENHWNRSA